MTPHRYLVAAVAALGLVVACGDDGGDDLTVGGDTGAPVPSVEVDPAAADEIVLSVEELAGLVRVLDAVRLPPALVVFGDGRLLQDRTGSLDSGETPAVPSLEERRLTDDGMEALAERLAAAGVTAEVDFGRPPIADAGAVRLRVVVDDRVVDNTVEAPGFVEGLGPSQQDARRAVDALLTDLVDLDDLLGDEVSAAAPARFDTWLAFTSSTDRPPPSGPGDADAVLVADWPLAPERAADAAAPLVCTALEGEDRDAVLDRAAGQFQTSVWELEDGSAVDLGLRPVVTGEDCGDFPEFAAR